MNKLKQQWAVRITRRTDSYWGNKGGDHKPDDALEEGPHWTKDKGHTGSEDGGTTRRLSMAFQGAYVQQ